MGLFASLPTVAWADVISEEEDQCRAKNEGDACSVGDEAGRCAKDSCSRNDYSEGVPPKTISVECLICKTGEAPKPAEVPEAKPATSGGCTLGSPPPVGLGLWLVGAAACRRRRRQSNSPRP